MIFSNFITNSGSSPQAALRACRRLFAHVGLVSMCINILMLTGSLYMLQVYDRALNSQSRATLLYLSLMAIGALLVLGLLEIVRTPPEHFAIDFIQLDAQGRVVTGDPKNLNSWHYYGTEIVAAAAGKVVAVVNDLPDQMSGQPPSDITVATAWGNHVITDMGDGRFALYAHFIPGSVAVSEGDIVTRGQLLGRLGNAGNTDAPHLHFQVMDQPSALDTDGLSFVFDRMESQEQAAVDALGELINVVSSGGTLQVDPAGSGQRKREIPLTLERRLAHS
jgi:Peptidase family M23